MFFKLSALIFVSLTSAKLLYRISKLNSENETDVKPVGFYKFFKESNDDYDLEKESQSLDKVLKTVDSVPNIRILLIAGGKNQSSLTSMEIYNPSDAKQNHILNVCLLQPRKSHIAGLIDNDTIIIAGGSNGSIRHPYYTRTSEIFNLTSMSITYGNDMKEVHTFADSAVHDGILYVCGGTSSDLKPMKKCEKYISGVWEYVADMPTTRSHLTMATVGDYIYAIGGSGKGGSVNGPLTTVERYSPKNDTWSTVAPLNSGRWDPSAAVVREHLVVCGGYDQTYLSSCERYNTTENQWFFITPMNKERHTLNLVAVGDFLIAMSGIRLASRSVEIYDVKTGNWTEIKEPLIDGRDDSAAIVLPN